MEVKEILKLACIFLSKEDLLEDEYFLEEVDETYVEDEFRQKEIDKLLNCLNLIYDEIAKDYIPLIYEQNIEFEDGKFFYSNLEKRIFDIYSLKSQSGRNLKYKIFPMYIFSPSKSGILTYSYQPEKLTLEGKIDFFDTKIPERVFAYGVAMEYSFIVSLSDEASIWEKRFKDSLLTAMRKKSVITMPSRRWFWCLNQKNYF